MCYADRKQAQADLEHLCEIAAAVRIFKDRVASIAAAMSNPIDIDFLSGAIDDVVSDATAGVSSTITNEMDAFDASRYLDEFNADRANYHARVL